MHWIIDFLNDRKFYVQVDDSSSSTRGIKVSVPQGAVPSPLLFNIYINDIPIPSEKWTEYASLFADDLNAFFVYKRNGQLQSKVSKYKVF